MTCRLCRIIAAGIVIFSMCLSWTSHAQHTVSIEATGGASAGAYERANSGVRFAPQPTYHITVGYAPISLLGAYVSYAQDSFGCDVGFCQDANVSFTSTGFGVGLRFGRAQRGGPWLRVGAVHRSLETQAGETFTRESDSELGVEASVGLALSLARWLKLVPAVRYTRYDVTEGNGAPPVGVAVVTGEIGFRLVF